MGRPATVGRAAVVCSDVTCWAGSALPMWGGLVRLAPPCPPPERFRARAALWACSLGIFARPAVPNYLKQWSTLAMNRLPRKVPLIGA